MKADQPARIACPRCGEPILRVARVCKHCGSEFGVLGDVHRYVPALSLLVAVLATAPGVIEEVSAALHTPAARLEILGAKSAGSRLLVSLGNLGDGTGVVAGDLTCTLGTIDQRELILGFSDPGNTVLRPGEIKEVEFGQSILAKVKGKEFATELEDMESLASLRSAILSGLNRGEGTGIDLSDPVSASCYLTVVGGDSPDSQVKLSLELGTDLYIIQYGMNLSP